MNRRRIMLLVAAVIAVGVGWLTLSYLNNVQPTPAAQQPVPRRSIVVAAVDIPAKKTITADMLKPSSRPLNDVEPDAIPAPPKAVGSVALVTIPAGSTITDSKIGKAVDAGAPVRLRPGQRALSIPIDSVKGVSGLITPGDRVDVIASPPVAPGRPPVAVTILRGATVLAVGDTLEQTRSGAGAPPPPQAMPAATVTLAVDASQADLLTNADLHATLRLALRSPEEPVRSMAPEHLDLSEPAPAPAAAPAQPVTVAARDTDRHEIPMVRPPLKPAAPGERGIAVIDGDRLVSGSLGGP